ncbi:arsenate reductase ArsC [Paucidesulfovibrio longus]|uniref:arsenate reductase ArsC n=1 Tax=Paucidesulfovibrio longus TaxID=889 RepID=UPI0003B38389|nr:arsenate reductase ArsC [Paucidesulfovibrio longus]
MDKTRVLFICNHNSGRSQMAEAFLKEFGGEDFEVESAGLEPTSVNPLVVEVMREIGIDLSGKRTQSVFDLYRMGRLYDYVITVCDDADEAKCPIFPGVAQRWHWPFPDPAAAEGTHEEKLEHIRAIRDQIKARIVRPHDLPFRVDSPFQE